MRAVLDINIIVSAALKRTSVPSRIVRSVLAGQHDLVISEAMMSELDEVLERPHVKARVTENHQREYLDLIRTRAVFFTPDDTTSGQADDDEDDIVLGTAVAGTGTGDIVTGNGRHKTGHYQDTVRPKWSARYQLLRATTRMVTSGR